MANVSQTLYTTLENISLSYIDLLNILGLEISEEIQNAAYDTAFNVVIRTQEQYRVLGLTTVKYYDSTNYSRVTINDMSLETIAESGSLALYNITSLEINFADISTNDSVEFVVSVAYNDTLYDLLLTITYRNVFGLVSTNTNETSDIHSWFLYLDNEKDFHKITIQLSNTEYNDYVYINTYSVTDFQNIIRESYLTDDPLIAGVPVYGKTARLYVDPICIQPFTITVTIAGDSTYTFEYKPSRINVSGMLYKRAPQMNSQNMSYGLLRANPKLTGNVKLVVDSNSDLYLDTFKVSETLQQKRFRKIKVGYNNYYGTDVMTKFRNVPSSEFYKVDTTCYNMFTSVSDYSLQYYDMYNYGVKTNDDLLYSENFAFLAPLCIKREVPDFFLIFKVHRESLDERTMTDEEHISYFLSNGTLVKSYDMRLGSQLGTYIRTIRDQAADKVGDIYISYDERNHTRYNGISLDRGVVTSLYESPVQQNYVNNQVALNDFYTLGFERNRLLSKDIINIEYMFDDTDEELFSINTYFGLYVKVNEQDESFSCIGKTYNTSTDTYNYEFDKEVKTFPVGTSLSDSETFSKLIYGLTTPTEFIRLNGSVIDSSYMENYIMKPYKNTLSLKVNTVSETSSNSFVYFRQDSLMIPGDHIRFIDEENLIVYEIIASNEDSLLSYNNYGLSEITSHFKNNLGSIDATIYRQSFYVRDDMTISEQTEVIYQALLAFNEYLNENFFYIVKKDETTLSVLSNSNNMIFEVLCSISLMDTDLTTLEEYTERNSDFYFYNAFYPEKCILDITDIWEGSNHSLFYPIDFDFVGSRIAYIVKFMPTVPETGTYYMIDTTTDLSILESNTLLYKQSGDTDNLSLYTPISYTWYSVNGIDFSENNIQTYYIPCYNVRDTRLILLDSPSIINNEVNFYTLIPLNSGVCSILNIKDFDFKVLDNVSILSRTSTIGHNIGDMGEFGDETYFGSPIFNTCEEYIQNYFDKYTKVDSCTLIDDVYAFNDFVYNRMQENKQKSSISLISPYVCKWKAIGTDARGNNLRIMADDSSLVDSNSFYIPYLQYTDNLGYIYDRDVSTFFEKHITKNINQMVYDDTSVSSEDILWGITHRDAILYGNARIDDILYDDNTQQCKFALTVKTGSNTIEFISGGIKFRIKSNNTNALNLEDCVGYEAVFVNVPSSETNTYPLELIIDKVNRQILLSMYSFYQEIETYDGFNALKIYDINSFNNLNINDDNIVLYTNTMLGDLNDSSTALYVTTMEQDSESYYKMNKIAIVGSLSLSSENNTAIITDASIFVDDSSMELTYDNYTQYTSTNTRAVSYYVLSDSSQEFSNIEHESQNLEKLQNSLDNCAIYVKTSLGVDELTNLDDLLTITIVDPIVSSRNENTEKYVHPTHIVPVMKEMLNFDYMTNTDEGFESEDGNSYELLEDIFEYSFDGANILINGLETIPQIWFNKYTEDTYFCKDKYSLHRLSLDFVQDRSIIRSCWDDGMFFNYNRTINGSESKTPISGYTVGAEIKSFLASKGINLNGSNGKQIVLTNWQNTEISTIDKYIKLNITDTLIYDILFRDSFNNYWSYLQLSNNNYKILYINNVILPLIHITNKTKFNFYKDNQQLSSYQFSSNYNETIPEISNITNELRYENGKYYMYLYPEDTGRYYAKVTIDL